MGEGTQNHAAKKHILVIGNIEHKRTEQVPPYPYIASSSGLGLRIVRVAAFG